VTSSRPGSRPTARASRRRDRSWGLLSGWCRMSRGSCSSGWCRRRRRGLRAVDGVGMATGRCWRQSCSWPRRAVRGSNCRQRRSGCQGRRLIGGSASGRRPGCGPNSTAWCSTSSVPAPILQRKVPRPALADRVRTLVPQNRYQLPEGARAQPGERGYPGRFRRLDHTSHTKIVSWRGWRLGPPLSCRSAETPTWGRVGISS